MGAHELQVERVVVDVDLSEAEAQRLTLVLRAAFEDLARRLEASPVMRQGSATRLALDVLRVDTLSASDLIGPRGAARLADALFEQLGASKFRS